MAIKAAPGVSPAEREPGVAPPTKHPWWTHLYVQVLAAIAIVLEASTTAVAARMDCQALIDFLSRRMKPRRLKPEF